MAGLVPAIHVFAPRKDVDARHKAGHDELGGCDCSKPEGYGVNLRRGLLARLVDRDVMAMR
jgi:hypothetical protein